MSRLVLGLVSMVAAISVHGNTVTFKQGHDLSGAYISDTGGYQGALDNAIEQGSPTWNDGWVYSMANLCGDFTGGSYDTRMLQIRYQDLFGPSAIPAGATIQSAKLRLGILEGYRPAPTAVEVYKALSPWYATAAEMSTAGYRQYMASPKVGWGAGNTASLPVMGEDFSTTSTDVAVNYGAYWNGTYYTPYTIQQWVEVDVTADVLAHQSGGTNWGWYVSANSPGWADGMLRPATSDASSVGWRPELVIEFTPIPEPVTFVSLGLGGLLILRRRG